MRTILKFGLTVALGLSLSGGALAQTKEIRVLLANHPYGDILKAEIPQFEKQSGIKVNVESLQESQLTTKLTTEFATNSSSVDVFMTRPLQDGKLFAKNKWYEPLAGYDFSDYPANTVSIVTYDGKPNIVPLVTEWQVLFYRKDLLAAAGIKVPTNFDELAAAAEKLNTGGVAGFASRGKGAAAVTQLSSYIYNFGGQYLDKGVAVFDSKEAVDGFRYYGKIVGSYGPRGVTSMSWENILPLFQAGRVAMWTDASVFYGQLTDPAKTSLGADKIGIANFPAGPKTNSPFYATSWGIAIASQSKKKDLAKTFLEWATSKELAAKAMGANITMARTSVWEDPAVVAKVDPGLVETRAFVAKNGYPTDRPFMSAVGEARDLIGEIVIESINTKGESPQIGDMAKDRVAKVNTLLRNTGEYGQ
ncbi:ABC transporter substrate-binding protein [Microvirga rosea]|uniref:ABC transporter substrate-binding protein n=1 Tax=Microvirga rosea TaxID=2715425 RepID=UPI001D0A7C04|nr:sugar ABC transporter substrate-binding protein [Microvirga rosea]MCB8822517.1 sugar ABC transporter substrate-binding protein [Microvirga rosea]